MLPESLRDKTLSRSGWAYDEHGLMGGDPPILRELQELILAQAASGLVVEAFDRGSAVFELGDPQASGELAVLPV
jgi:hypothetical protein